MASSAESNASINFIKDQKERYGKILAINKVIDKISVGTADIFAVYKGLPLFAESKWMNSITLTNNREFTPIQLEFLERRSKAGAMCIGLLLSDGFILRIKPHTMTSLNAELRR